MKKRKAVKRSVKPEPIDFNLSMEEVWSMSVEDQVKLVKDIKRGKYKQKDKPVDFPTLERINELFDCDPLVGELVRKSDTVDGPKGHVCTDLVGPDGYFYVYVDGEIWPVHWVCYMIYHGYCPGVRDDRLSKVAC